MTEVIMPKMGDAMIEGKVLKWRKRPGDVVAKGEAIAEIETDKVNVDIESEDAGTLVEIVVGEGQTAPVGATIAIIGAPGQKRAEPSPPPRSMEVAPQPTPRPQVAQTPKRSPTADAAHVSVSPLARRLATEHGIDLREVRGSGPEGRIIKEDVEALLTRPPVAPGAPMPTGAQYDDLPLTRMRQTIARRMVESKQHAPHFYVTVEVTMDDALRARQQLNDAVGEARKVSVNDFLVKASAVALGKFPNLNSAFFEEKIRRFTRINIAIAVALPEGLIAPVLHDCDRKSLLTLAADAKALAERARAGHLRPEDYEGGTFTVSNLGMFDVESFVAIINPPHAGILAVGSAQARPVVRHNEVTVASIMKLTLSADHRITDGAEAAQFLMEVKRLLENPLQLLLEERPDT